MSRKFDVLIVCLYLRLRTVTHVKFIMLFSVCLQIFSTVDVLMHSAIRTSSNKISNICLLFVCTILFQGDQNETMVDCMNGK